MARNAIGTTMAAVNLLGVSAWAAAGLDVAGDGVVLVIELGVLVAERKVGASIAVDIGPAVMIGPPPMGALVVAAAEGFS